MDRIIVKTNADMARVLDWAEELHGLAVELPWSEGEIEFREELVLLKFRESLGGGTVEFEMWIHPDEKSEYMKIADWKYSLEDEKILDLKIAGSGTKHVSLGFLLARDNTVGKCVRKFRGLMLFAAYYREEVARTKVVTRSSGKRKPGSGKSKSGGKRMLTIRRYMIGEEVLSELPRKYRRHTDSWCVRGHYRTYKSGKTVWIRPYKKGSAEKQEDKEYIL